MGEFIQIKIDYDKCGEPNECEEWVRICPVNIFKMEGDRPVVIEENEDECTLCELCLQTGVPGTITIVKLYEQDKK